MQHFTDLGIVLKSFRYQERDQVIVILTENNGKITALAKGGVSSKRFGGALDFLACSDFNWVFKPTSEMCRIESAVVRYELKTLHGDFEILTAASFMAEFCLKLIELNTPVRELFIILSNGLYYLNKGLSPNITVVTFLSKMFRALGYGGIDLSESHTELNILRLDQILTNTSFKEIFGLNAELSQSFSSALELQELFSKYSNFLTHQMSGMPSSGLKSLKLLSETSFDQK